MTPLQSQISSDKEDLGFQRLWLPLPGRPGVRCIRLRWLYDRAEPLDRPNLAPPLVADARTGPTLCTVMVPAGWKGSLAGASGWQGAERQAALELYRAEAQLHILQDLGKQRGDRAVSAALADVQQRFALHRHRARQALDVGGDRLLTSEMRNLKSEILRAGEPAAPAAGFGLGLHPAADAAGSPARISDLEFRGTPMSWQMPPGAEPPMFQLTSRASQRTRQALADSGQWLGGLLVVWILALLPFLLTRLRLFWPEQIALLGLLGWHVAGLTIIVLGLLLIAACGRVFLLIRSLRTLFRARRPQPNISNAGSGAIS